jgi:hypothetical protein
LKRLHATSGARLVVLAVPVSYLRHQRRCRWPGRPGLAGRAARRAAPQAYGCPGLIRYRAGRLGHIVVLYVSPDPRSSTVSMGKATAGCEALHNGGQALNANYSGGSAKACAVVAGKAGQIARHGRTRRALLRGQLASS